MLFELADELLSALPELDADQAWHDALGNLGRAVYEGKHVVTASFLVLEQILAQTAGEPSVQGYFRNIKHQLQKSQQLLRSLPERAQIHAQPGPLVTHQKLAELDLHRVHYRYLADSSRTQKTALVTEDLNDAAIYLAATWAYLARRSPQDIRGTQLALAEHQGGGRRTADVADARAAEGPTLCIADSDRHAPDATVGKTARPLQERSSPGRQHVLRSDHILPCQELENLLSETLLRSAVASATNEPQARRDDWLSRIDGLAAQGLLASGPESWLLDLKSDKHRRGLTQHMGRLVAAFVKKHPDHEAIGSLFSVQSAEVLQAWRELCEKVISWGCALRRLST